MLKTISFIEWNRLRVRRHDLHVQKVFIENHNSFHQFIADVVALIRWLYKKIVQKCNCFAIIKCTN